MPEFVSVPVPVDLVHQVYALIANGGQKESSNESPLSRHVEGVSRDWTREEFERLAASDATSIQSFCQVLDILSDISPQSMTIDQIGRQLGEPALTLQKRFGAASRWMGKRNGDIAWPISFANGTGNWFMNTHNASLWKEIQR